MRKRLLVVITNIITLFITFASPVAAQVKIKDNYKGPLDALELNAIGALVSVLLNNAYIVAGVLLLVFILLGGLNMIAGAGSKDAQKAAQSKMAVTWAVLGFLIIFASYWIIQLVELITGVKIL